jgi:assimilatory nitrate reductase catalytic subunit
MTAIRKGLRRLGNALIRRDGPLTRELVLYPARFGLGRLPARVQPDAVVRSICGFCSTGCSLDVLSKGGEVIGLVPSKGYPVNRGAACPKGWEALAPLAGEGRATTPLVRRGGSLVPVTWETALQEMVDRFKEIQAKHGNRAVAWLGTGQMPSEELAFLGALAKFGMGIVHGDGNTRQCMATAAVAYRQAFGFDAPPFAYADFEESDVIVLVGSNLCIAHPILWERVCRNRHSPTIVVIDPRATETSMAASLHYAVKPKSDLALLYAVANVLISNGHIDRAFIEAHTTGFEDYAREVARFTPESVANETGIDAERIRELARIIQRGERVSLWWTMGVNQSHQGVRTAQAIIALALLTGNIGRPGTGANSITGQCNAMGSRLFSNTTNLFGGRDFADEGDRAEVARILDIDAQLIPHEPSLPYHRIVDGISAGEIRALWVVATNPAHSWIHQARMHEELEKLDCLVVQDMYADTETAAHADIVLPAAGWGEKEGTFINSERRIGTIKRVCRAPGQALADFHIFQLLAEEWGCADLFRAWSSPEAVFQILKQLSRGRPCDITGIEDYPTLDRSGGIQWPYPEGRVEEKHERRLFEDGHFFTPDRRARFFFSEPRPLPEPADDAYPLTLLTGRGSSSQWHTQTRTKRSLILQKLSANELYLEISSVDAEGLGIRSEQLVTVSSRRGSVSARVFVTNSVKPGEVFMPMHYQTINLLTLAAFDPHSHQPAYKACAVRIARQ